MAMLLAEPFGGACTKAAMERLSKRVSPLAPDFIVGMGGGKAIDTAKGVAFKLGLPLVSIPTLVSNCAPITALSVVYKNEGPFDCFLFYDAPPALTLIDLTICAGAPAKYFRAALGDTVAKYLEAQFSRRNDVLGETMDHMSSIALSLSSTCYDPILQYGRQGLDEAERGEAGKAFELCARSAILSTGLVSLMADDCFNGALAHSVCYGLQIFEDIEVSRLHGDLVAYGCLVQLMLDHQETEAKRLHAFLQSIGTETTLAEIGLPLDRAYLDAMLAETVSGPDMRHIPYPITPDMVFDAMVQVEAL